MSGPKSQSLTVKANGGALRELKTECSIAEAFDPSNTPNPPQGQKFLALWDTGASGSVICQDVVDALGLVATGQVKVHGVTGEHLSPTFLVNIMLPNGVHFPGLTVTLGKFHGFHMLVGMDIITEGDFSITNKDGSTVFSFRCPSMHHIDYVAQHRADAASESRVADMLKRSAKPGRTHGTKRR